ncbi:UvrD-helicase domain-containing protein [Mollicutes bacterium LVI A0039]|nr:UvrD-helicase domain-containing protein [Mollicutes bacterium LVI A0039]
MKQKPIDAIWTDEQWKAIAIRDTNVLVSAGAGSGKTAVLSERVLELVSEGVDVTNLVVLTFTNAAALEMKQRIRKKLLSSGADNEWIMENAKKLDRSFITTFDSYCLYLVKKYNYVLNIDQQISIIDNITASQKKYELMEQVLNELVASQDQQVIDFIKTYSSVSIDEVISLLLKWYSDLSQNMSEFKLLNATDIFAEFEAIVSSKQSKIKHIIEQIELYAADTQLPEKIAERCQILCMAEGYEQIQAGFETVFEKRWMLPRTDFDNKELVRSLNDNLKKELKSLSSMVSKDRQHHIELLNQNQVVKQLIFKILTLFKRKYDQYKKANGLFEFIDINLMAIALLENNAEICEQIKTRTYEIMIDEYQDTNDIQEKFVSLIADNNVYMVGDIKQSIYGFRNANPQLFSEKFNLYKQHIGGELVTLTSNFRSRSAVLDQVNNFFGLIMSDEYGGITYDQDQIMKYGNRSYDLLADTNTNEIITYDANELAIDKNDYEIIQIFKDIKSKLTSGYQVVDNGQARAVNEADFAIICATRERFQRIVQIGEFYNISVNADIQEQFASSSEIAVVQSVFNILNCIKNQNDDDQKFVYSVMQLARSYLFDARDGDIDLAITALNKIKPEQIGKRLYSLQLGPLSEIGLLCNELAASIDLKSNSYILQQIIEKFEIVNKLHRLTNPLVRQMRLNKLSALIADYDARNYSLSQVCLILNNIEQNKDLDIEFSSNSDLETNSVTVITTHKSKGLEYNICYFPFLFKKFNVMDINSKVGYAQDLQFILPAQLANGNLTATMEKTIFNQRSTRDLISEKIRLFYVAITRAKDKNILILDTSGLEDKVVPIENTSTINNLIYNGWDALKQYVVNAQELTSVEIETSQFNKFVNTAQEQVKDVDALTYQELSIEVTDYEKVRASGHIAEAITKEVAKNIELGNTIHQQLEFIDLFRLEELVEQADGQLQVVLKNIANSRLLEGMINYYPEFQFKYITDSEVNGIIDLLVETDDSFIIIDYKLSNINKEEYVSQVTTYVNYIQSITTKQVKGYLLSLLTGDVKQVI